MEGEIGREMDTHIDGARDVNDRDGEAIRSCSTDSYLPTHADTASDSTNSNTAYSHSNTQTKARKPMLIPIPTDKGVELVQLPDYIPPRKDVWRELRAGDDEGDAGLSARGDGADERVVGGDVDGERELGGDEDEYAPLSIVKPYTPSHSTYPYNNNPSSNPSSHSTYPYNPYTPSSSSYPSFTLNLGVEESPLGALTPLTPLTPRTPGGRWFDPFPGQGQGQDSERDGTLDERDNGIDVVDGIQGSTMRKGKRKQKENTENDKEYVDGDCGICFEEAVRPTLTPCCARVFCAEHLDEWLQGTESDGRCPACKKRLDPSSYSYSLSTSSLSSPSFSSSRPLSQPHTIYRNDADDADAAADQHGGEGKYAGGGGVETTSAWKWLASWLVPEPTTSSSTQHSASSAHPSHPHPPAPPSDSQIHQVHPASSASSSQQQPSHSDRLSQHSQPPHNPQTAPHSRGRYGSSYTPYPYTPITGTPGAGTPSTPGTPPATQGFIPMSPFPSTSGINGAGRVGDGRSVHVHPLSEHVEEDRAVQEGEKEAEGGGQGEGKGKGKERDRVDVQKEEEEEGSGGGGGSGGGSSSASTSTSRSNSSPEIAGEGSSSSTCTTPPLPTLASIVVDGEKSPSPSPALLHANASSGDTVGKSPGEDSGGEVDGDVDVGGDVEVEVDVKRQTRVEDVDLVGTLSRFLSLVGLLGLFYVLLS